MGLLKAADLVSLAMRDRFQVQSECAALPFFAAGQDELLGIVGEYPDAGSTLLER